MYTDDIYANPDTDHPLIGRLQHSKGGISSALTLMSAMGKNLVAKKTVKKVGNDQVAELEEVVEESGGADDDGGTSDMPISTISPPVTVVNVKPAASGETSEETSDSKSSSSSNQPSHDKPHLQIQLPQQQQQQQQQQQPQRQRPQQLMITVPKAEEDFYRNIKLTLAKEHRVKLMDVDTPVTTTLPGSPTALVSPFRGKRRGSADSDNRSSIFNNGGNAKGNPKGFHEDKYLMDDPSFKRALQTVVWCVVALVFGVLLAVTIGTALNLSPDVNKCLTVQQPAVPPKAP
jgi:hypothetical protein